MSRRRAPLWCPIVSMVFTVLASANVAGLVLARNWDFPTCFMAVGGTVALASAFTLAVYEAGGRSATSTTAEGDGSGGVVIEDLEGECSEALRQSKQVAHGDGSDPECLDPSRRYECQYHDGMVDGMAVVLAFISEKRAL